jgi:hypothetical protein
LSRVLEPDGLRVLFGDAEHLRLPSGCMFAINGLQQQLAPAAAADDSDPEIFNVFEHGVLSSGVVGNPLRYRQTILSAVIYQLGNLKEAGGGDGARVRTAAAADRVDKEGHN